MSAPNEETQRLRVIRLAQSAGLPVRKLLRLSDGERDTLATCTDAECLAYLHALLLRATLRAGKVPQGWTQVCRCEGCGEVWLWPGAPAEVQACPWCWNRRAGLHVPAVEWRQ